MPLKPPKGHVTGRMWLRLIFSESAKFDLGQFQFVDFSWKKKLLQILLDQHAKVHHAYCHGKIKTEFFSGLFERMIFFCNQSQVQIKIILVIGTNELFLRLLRSKQKVTPDLHQPVAPIESLKGGYWPPTCNWQDLLTFDKFWLRLSTS